MSQHVCEWGYVTVPKRHGGVVTEVRCSRCGAYPPPERRDEIERRLHEKSERLWELAGMGR